MKSVYNNSLWRLPWVFHVGQGKWLALFPKLSGRYSTTLHCTHSTWLWVQACGLDLGEWAHPIYIQAITNRSERHMHAHNCIDCLSRQQCSLPSTEKTPRHRGNLLPQQAVHSTPTVIESVILEAAAWHSFTLLPLHTARKVRDRPPDCRPPCPLAPCSCSLNQVLSVHARDFKESEWR